MSITDSVIVSLLGMLVVFVVLILLSFLIYIQSKILRYLASYQQRKEDAAQAKIIAQAEPEDTGTEDEGWSAGELKLIGVDERTAAMIMAIVSDESQIPLSELQFKMIKAVDQNTQA
ncbi:MAG TPA: OadG family transporter subunit [Syntrophomonadaceae bacterium]|nr:OadG family transporter subunit [Syntrophomonadaceae bacterium]HNX29576.1 OadG family transporter subunit [Syntrophomonadaceae bacterium]HPR94229.1 OadG family transporter subunit [Syntrophomonadaceae bacterium]